MVEFTTIEVRNVQANFYTIKCVINIEITEELLCFACNNGRGDKILSRVTNFFGEETFLTVFF